MKTELEVVREISKLRILSGKELAKVMGVSYRTLYRWLKTREKVQLGELAKTRIRDIENIFDVLKKVLPEAAVKSWLLNNNRYLNGKRPVDFLIEGKAGKIEQISQLALDLRDGVLSPLVLSDVRIY